MRILSVVDGIGWGGTKEQVYLLAREFAKRDTDIHLALAFEYVHMVEKLKPYRVKLHFFEHHNKLSRFNLANYYKLWKIIKDNDFDIVIANSPHAFDFVRMVYPFLKKRPKLVAVKRSGRMPNILSLRLKYAYADALVAVSPAIKESLVKAGFPEEKVFVIESGIDTERFRKNEEARWHTRKKLGLSSEHKVFINVANWNPKVKGQDRLIQAFSKMQCDRCYLVLVGIDTDLYAPPIAKGYGIGDRVLALGFREDVENLLNASDFFVLSSYLEGISNSLLQAMACGKVVISTNAGGIGKVIKDGYNGFLVDVGDFEGLAKKMLHVLKLSEQELSEISQRASITAQDFSISKTVDAYEKLFERLTS